jgi:phospholipase/lecithinase/hemolysin
LLLLCPVVASLAKAQPVEKLFAFGDSYTDSGAGYVDGNGPTAIVYVAQDLGLSFTHAADPQGAGKGLNFAVSGARTGEGDGRRVKGALLGYGMQNQVRDFAARVDKGEIAFDPARTVFFIAGGLNDRTLTTEVTVANLTQVVRGLYAAGARKFLVAVLPEKIPSFAEVGRRLNPALAQLPGELQAAFPDADIRSSGWGRYFDAVMEAPAKYGISNTTDACAERWIFDQDPTPRGDPITYYFYHSGHPSTTVQRHVANELKREILALTRPGAP